MELFERLYKVIKWIRENNAKEVSIAIEVQPSLLGKAEALHIYAERNELFKIVLPIQLTRIFFLASCR